MTALMLKTVTAQMTAHGGFVWPDSGPVTAPDWDPAPHCGNGLHGLLWGEGEGGLLNWEPDARWLVCEIDETLAVDLGGKIKVPAATVVHCGDRITATAFLQADPRAAGRVVHGGTATAGTRGTATAGDGGTATAGDGGTATAGDGGTATAGYGGTATAGTRGTATAGTRGTATAGYGGTATAGYGGTATAGTGGTATAGYEGVLTIHWYDARGLYRVRVAEVGENGIEPDVAYRLNDKGEFVKAKTTNAKTRS